MYLIPVAGLTFASQAVGTPSATQTVTIANSGLGPMNVSNVGFTGSDPGDFQIATGGTCTGTSFALAPTASCTVLISFNPTNSGSRSASLSITDDAPNSPQAIPLSGTGLAPAVSLPPSVAFGSVPQFATSAVMTVTLTNTGNAPLNFSAPPALSGANAADFAITGGTCAVGAAVPGSNGICTATVTFTPSTSAAETASLDFADNAIPAMQSVALTGTGIAPGVSISAIAPFGNQTVNTTGAPQTVTVSVTSGTGTLQVISINITGANASDFPFTSGSTCPLAGGQVAGGTSCTIMIAFGPTAVGARTATLTINASNLPGGPATLPLSGTGTAAPAPAVSLSTTALQFGVVPVGTPSTPMGVTVTNTGNGYLIFNSITITGANAADFTISGSSCPTEGAVPPNGNCVVNVIFTPTVATPEAAALTIRDNAAGSPHTVTLSGGGPGFTLTAMSTTGGNGSIVSILPGDTGVFTLQLTCSPGVMGTVVLANGGSLPPSTILTISPQMVTCPSANPITITLTLQTNCVVSLVAPHSPWQTPLDGGLPGAPPAALPLVALSSALLLFAVRRRTAQVAPRLAPMLAALALVLLVGTFTACVHNDPPILPNAPTTPAGTYQLAVVGTGPTGAKSTLMLTVRVI